MAMALDHGFRGRGTGRGCRGRGRGRAYNNVNTGMQNMNINGTGGTPKTELYANYFPVDISEEWVVYQYCVTFTPEVDSKSLRQQQLFSHGKVLGDIKVYDGRMLYIPRHLKDEVEMNYHLNDGSNGIITLKFCQELNPRSPQCMQIYNIVLRRMLYILGMKEIGRNFYNPTEIKPVDKYNIDILTGVKASFLQCAAGLHLSVDISFKPICQRSLYDEYNHLGGRQYKQAVVGKVVMTRYNNKTYTIQDVDFDSSPNSKFTTSDGRIFAYHNYMTQQHNKPRARSEQPMLVVYADRRKEQQLLLIPEFCHLADMPDKMRADDFIQRDYAQHIRLTPQRRNQQLITFINKLISNPQCSELLDGWNLSIRSRNATLDSKVLAPEGILVGDSHMIKYNPDKADWASEMRSKKLCNPKVFSGWVLLTDSGSLNDVNDFLAKLREVVVPLGIKVDKPHIENVGDGRIRNYVEGIKANCSGPVKPMFIICVIPKHSTDLYNAIKRACFVEHGVSNQCIVRKTLIRKNALMTCTTKIANLISVKVGAEPWQVNIPLNSCMSIGIDTYHASKQRSVSGIVCSINRNMTQYYSRACFNHEYGEMVSELGIIVKDAIMKYKEVNSTLPQCLVVYRDGVSDGQMAHIKSYELPQIREACKAIGQDYKPGIAVIICQKRISSRFSAQSKDGLVNPPPGTLICENITRPEHEDFYLISQTVRQGSVVPTHYVILHNDIEKLNSNRIHILTYKLCHLYFNWMATVKVPAPCQYAHKLAYMIGNSLREMPHIDLSDKLYYL